MLTDEFGSEEYQGEFSPEFPSEYLDEDSEDYYYDEDLEFEEDSEESAYADSAYADWDDYPYIGPDAQGYAQDDPGAFVEMYGDPASHSEGVRPGSVLLGVLATNIVLALFLLYLTVGTSFPAVAAGVGGGEVTIQSQDANTADAACAVSDSFPANVRQWCGLITSYASQRNLPPDLVAALIWQESGGNAEAYSHSGAMGLMQVMPRDGLAASFMCKNGPCFSDRPSMQELRDPEFNISYGTKMLANLLARRGSLREALKYYGPMDVGYYYADKVLGLFQQYGNP
jgi:hypothetical protein